MLDKEACCREKPMNAKIRKQVIAQEWLIDSQQPLQSISRLRYRGTYAEVTLWWLVVQLDLLDKAIANTSLRESNEANQP
jgi:hypothetical protein